MRNLCNYILLIASFSLVFSPIFAQQHSEAITPIVPEIEIEDQAKIDLGKTLYFDPLFSFTHADSCNTCHNIKRGGIDNMTSYIGIYNKIGYLNTPTIFNVKNNFRQFWNGRAKDLNAVIEDHLKDPTIFKNNWEVVLKRIEGSPQLVNQFKQVYNSRNPDKEQVKEALISYLDTLITPQSRFDLYLQGNKNALSSKAQKGYAAFKKYGCVTCHQGPNIGGNLYQKLGIYKDYFKDKKNIQEADYGLFLVTGNEEDRYVFKVPSLRNITLTNPYLHDGSAKTLREVIQIMGIYQVGQQIPPYEVDQIIEFLISLTGRMPQEENKKK